MTALWKRRARAAGEAPPARVAGVVPAAGISGRMGTPKALLDAGGRSFVSAVVGALVGGGCDPVVVVVGPGQDDVVRRAKAAGAVTLVNPEPGEGPITSLRLALASLDAGVRGVALLPVDHPGVTPETVARLVGAFLEGDAPLVLPTSGGRHGHPSIFSRRLFPTLMDPALQGGARTVVHQHLSEALSVDVDDPGILADIDTPEAYRRTFGTEARP